MGVYAVTGGSSGIGAKTAEVLRNKGNTVYNIDIAGGDINANLADEAGRKHVAEELHRLCPHGLDGLVCCAGVSNSCMNLKLIISLNYFGAVAVAEGAFDLLKKAGGSCVIISSNSIDQGVARTDIADILNNRGDEKLALSVVDKLEAARDGHPIYVTSKYAVARWARRVSAQWAAEGVRINFVAPGNVETAMTAKMSPQERMACMALPIPTLYGEDRLMDPEDLANTIAFLLSKEAHGLNGVVLFCDGGTDAAVCPERVL